MALAGGGARGGRYSLLRGCSIFIWLCSVPSPTPLVPSRVVIQVGYAQRSVGNCVSAKKFLGRR